VIDARNVLNDGLDRAAFLLQQREVGAENFDVGDA
jgi:hypothetical protein